MENSFKSSQTYKHLSGIWIELQTFKWNLDWKILRGTYGKLIIAKSS